MIMTRYLHKWVGWVLAVVLWALTIGRGRADGGRMRRLDFGSSTQKMGVRFTERVRNVWRHRWLRIKR